MIRVADWLAKRASLSPNRIALIEAATGRRISYAEWNARANRAAHALQALGLRKWDLLAILSTNRLEYLDVLFACQKSGAILQALNFRLAIPELQALLQDIPPRALIYSGDLAEKAAALEEAAPVMIALDEPVRSTHQRWSDLQERASDQPPAPVSLAPDDPWVLCYTGGTTGLPKAAILTHGTITWNAINTVMSWGLRSDDVAILNAPLFHTGGLNVFTTPLVHIGGTSILCATFDPDQVFDLLERERVTLFFGVPTMFIRLQQHPRWERSDFSRCRIVISGGAPCPMPVFERFFEKGVPFKTGYGLTEAGPNNFWLPDEKTHRKPGSVGSPLFHVEVRIVREDRDVGPGEVGELWIRGPHV
ncbi:MAG: AMP-binding protein, partial [Blastocatellia bacterium]|nr:AMP-binding protein [Blastocatellia bacterium]MDW8255830.1 AMP-binding protein [Acidobacteriota bacterium]